MRKKISKILYKKQTIYAVKRYGQYNVNNMIKLLKYIKKNTHNENLYIRNYGCGVNESDLMSIKEVQYAYSNICIIAKIDNSSKYLTLSNLLDELIKFRKKYGNKTILIKIEDMNSAGGFSEIADVGGKLEILF